jgi:hypothetical protein
MAETLYASLVHAFLAASAPDQAPPTDEPGALQFQVDDHTCTVFALEGDRQLVMQAEVMGLGGLSAESAASALRLLHGLNWAARESTGIVAMIDPDEQLLVSKTLEMRQLDADSLGAEMAALLEAAASLGTVLKASAEAGETEPATTAASSLDYHRFS